MTNATLDPAEATKMLEARMGALVTDLRKELETSFDKRSTDNATKLGNELQAVRDELKKLSEAQARRTHVPGLTAEEPEVKNFSIAKCVAASEDGNWKKAAAEHEVVKAHMRLEESQKLWERLYDQAPLRQSDARKDMNSSDDPKGGFLVPPAVMTARLIDKLRARSAILRLGAQMFPDASGYDPISIPRLVSTTTPAYSKETGTTAAQDAAFEEIVMRPHLITSRIDFSMRLARNSPISVNGIFETLLSKDIAEKWDTGCINGGALAGEPVGILNQNGIGTQAFGGVDLANSGVYDLLIAMMGKLGEANAIEFGSDSPETLPYKWLMPVATGWQKLAQQKDPTDNSQPKARRLFSEGPFKALLGLGYVASTHVPASNLAIGDWSQYAVVTWGGLAIYLDRQTVNGKLTNSILGAMEYDGIPLQPSAFVKGTGIA